MKTRSVSNWGILAVSSLLLLSGCDDTATKQVKVRPPAPAPTSAALDNASLAAALHQPLPLTQRSRYNQLHYSPTLGRRSMFLVPERFNPATMPGKPNSRLAASTRPRPISIAR